MYFSRQGKDDQLRALAGPLYYVGLSCRKTRDVLREWEDVSHEATRQWHHRIGDAFPRLGRKHGRVTVILDLAFTAICNSWGRQVHSLHRFRGSARPSVDLAQAPSSRGWISLDCACVLQSLLCTSDLMLPLGPVIWTGSSDGTTQRNCTCPYPGMEGGTTPPLEAFWYKMDPGRLLGYAQPWLWEETT